VTDLSPEVIARFAERRPLLVATDFDGTLAPLVDHPDQARMTPEARRVLADLVAVDGVWVLLLSGRSLADLREIADPPAGVLLVGGHGNEFESPLVRGAQTPLPSVDSMDSVLDALEAELFAIANDCPGAVVETKPHSVAFHTRRANPADGASATERVLALPVPPGLRTLRGKEVIEFVAGSATKGTALIDVRNQLEIAPGSTVYFGDDVTDEFAFRALDSSEGDISVKVGPGETAARYRVADASALIAVLNQLLNHLVE
jgi:trehalose-phosphatase